MHFVGFPLRQGIAKSLSKEFVDPCAVRDVASKLLSHASVAIDAAQINHRQLAWCIGEGPVRTLYEHLAEQSVRLDVGVNHSP